MPRRKLFRGHQTRWFYALAGVLILSALAATIVWLGPLPPRVLIMSTGTPGSDYDVLGRRYQTILKGLGVDLRLVPSAGGVENNVAQLAPVVDARGAMSRMSMSAGSDRDVIPLVREATGVPAGMARPRAALAT